MAKISVVTPVGSAFDTVKRILFQPFEITKWFGMGFTAWIATLTEGFGSGFSGFNSGNQNIKEMPEQILPWIQSHLALLICSGVVLFLIIIAISLVVNWISSRGKFMFLDNVVKNRGEIKEPWKHYKTQGNSYFLFSICFGLASIAATLISIAICVAVALPNIIAQNFGFNAIAAIILGVFFIFGIGLVNGCVYVFLHDFIAPLMMLRSCRVLAAFSIFFSLFKATPGIFILYLLFRFVLSVAIASISSLLCCLLCCTVLLPYLGAVILLPLHVFWRSYSVHFLAQFGEDYQLL